MEPRGVYEIILDSIKESYEPPKLSPSGPTFKTRQEAQLEGLKNINEIYQEIKYLHGKKVLYQKLEGNLKLTRGQTSLSFSCYIHHKQIETIDICTISYEAISTFNFLDQTELFIPEVTLRPDIYYICPRTNKLVMNNMEFNYEDFVAIMYPFLR